MLEDIKIPSTSIWARNAKSWWQNELEKMMGIQSGEMTPWQFPEFKNAEAAMQKSNTKNFANLYNMLAKRGVQGGPMSQILSNYEEGNRTNPLQLIVNWYNQAYQRGGEASKQGLDWKKYQNSLAMQWKQMHNANQGSSIGGIASGLGGLLGMMMGGPAGGGIGSMLGSLGGLFGGGGGGQVGPEFYAPENGFPTYFGASDPNLYNG